MNQFCEIGYYHYAHLFQVFQYLIFLKKNCLRIHIFQSLCYDISPLAY